MAKTVFSGDMVFHVWANQSVPHGKRSDGRVYFEGATLYSYGSHYALGHVMPAGVALLNSDSYSVSTGKHKSQTLRAVRGVYLFVPGLTDLLRSSLFRPEPGFRHFDGTYREATAAEWKAIRRADLSAYLTKNAHAISPESAAYLLGMVDLKPATFDKIKAARIRADDKAKVDAERTRHNNALNRARQYVKESDAETRAAFREHMGTSTYRTDERAKGFISSYREAHKAASKAGLSTIKAKLWSKIGMLTAERDRADAIVALTNKRQSVRRAVRDLIQYRDNARAAEPKTLTLPIWRRVAESAVTLGRHVETRASMVNLDRSLSALAEEARGHIARLETAEREERARQYEESERRRAAERAEREEREKANKAAWFEGDTSASWHGRTDNGGAYLRAINVERDESGAIVAGTLQTSQGAEVPLTHALRAFRFLKLCRDKAQGWQANGRTIPVGHFRVDSIAANGDFRAGCHFIEWSEVSRVAQSLGVLGVAPDESAIVETAHA